MQINTAAVTTLAAGSLDDPNCEVTTGFLAEASSLGFGVGEWPQTIEFDGSVWTKHNVVRHPADNDLIAVDYDAGRSSYAGPVLLTVLND